MSNRMVFHALGILSMLIGSRFIYMYFTKEYYLYNAICTCSPDRWIWPELELLVWVLLAVLGIVFVLFSGGKKCPRS